MTISSHEGDYPIPELFLQNDELLLCQKLDDLTASRENIITSAARYRDVPIAYYFDKFQGATNQWAESMIDFVDHLAETYTANAPEIVAGRCIEEDEFRVEALQRILPEGNFLVGPLTKKELVVYFEPCEPEDTLDVEAAKSLFMDYGGRDYNEFVSVVRDGKRGKIAEAIPKVGKAAADIAKVSLGVWLGIRVAGRNKNSN